MAICVRELIDEERAKIERLCHAQAAPPRLVHRAWIIKLSADGQSVSAIAGQVALGKDVVRHWIHCFNAAGLAGLDDASRSGRPYTYSEEERSRVIAKARSLPPKPAGDAVPPTCHWTLDQLQRELNKAGLPIKRSQIRRILKAEHIKWQKPRTWLESDDPEFAEKRGPSSASTRHRLLAVRS
ncbi:MAG: helix-turn-helix domain-containing protein [Chloroflexi bacterium]|nr:helix-turn-helix domain-containing protein [Chloroflexota bacterium]